MLQFWEKDLGQTKWVLKNASILEIEFDNRLLVVGRCFFKIFFQYFAQWQKNALEYHSVEFFSNMHKFITAGFQILWVL